MRRNSDLVAAGPKKRLKKERGKNEPGFWAALKTFRAQLWDVGGRGFKKKKERVGKTGGPCMRGVPNARKTKSRWPREKGTLHNKKGTRTREKGYNREEKKW